MTCKSLIETSKVELELKWCSPVEEVDGGWKLISVVIVDKIRTR